MNRCKFENIYKNEVDKISKYLLTEDLTDIELNLVDNWEYGIECDKNSQKRSEIVAVLFFTYDINNEKYEKLAEKLFSIEIKHTQKNQSSSTYSALMLTSLLLENNKDNKYENLFNDYKELNYDTYCAYSIGYCESDYPFKSIEDYPEEEILDFLIDIDCEDLASKLID